MSSNRKKKYSESSSDSSNDSSSSEEEKRYKSKKHKHYSDDSDSDHISKKKYQASSDDSDSQKATSRKPTSRTKSEVDFKYRKEDSSSMTRYHNHHSSRHKDQKSKEKDDWDRKESHSRDKHDRKVYESKEKHNANRRDDRNYNRDKYDYNRDRYDDNDKSRYKDRHDYNDREESRSRSREREKNREFDNRRDQGNDRHRRREGFRRKRSSSFDHANAKWGKPEDESRSKKEPSQKDKPNFGLSGKLTEETNTFKGVVIKYSEPPEARKPRRRWRLYPFKGEKSLQILYIHRESAYLIGRERKVVDLPVDHPSCSKQHAALQYRLVPFTRENGTTGKRVRPYLIDLESANGTFINNKKIDPKKYYELFERDVIKFGFSSREYVLLHENSKDDALDDDVKMEEEDQLEVKIKKEVKKEP